MQAGYDVYTASETAKCHSGCLICNGKQTDGYNARLRVGYALDNLLITAVYGHREVNGEVYTTYPDGSHIDGGAVTTGTIEVGVNIDYALSENTVVGFEYMQGTEMLFENSGHQIGAPSQHIGITLRYMF